MCLNIGHQGLFYEKQCEDWQWLIRKEIEAYRYLLGNHVLFARNTSS